MMDALIQISDTHAKLSSPESFSDQKLQEMIEHLRVILHFRRLKVMLPPVMVGDYIKAFRKDNDSWLWPEFCGKVLGIHPKSCHVDDPIHSHSYKSPGYGRPVRIWYHKYNIEILTLKEWKILEPKLIHKRDDRARRERQKLEKATEAMLEM